MALSTREFDLVIVGCGLFGATIAQQFIQNNRKVLILDKRPHIGGNVYTELVEGIQVHRYGAHIFHTSNQKIWQYVNQFSRFNHFVNRPKVRYQNQLYSFPINLMTLSQLWGVTTPEEAKKKLETVRIPCDSPRNLEDWILSQVGKEIYETFIKGYTQKQWGRPPAQLPAFIIKRLPIRLTFDDNYFNDPYQGIPIGGYTPMIQAMIQGATLELGVDFFSDREVYRARGKRLVFTGSIDAYFNHCFGHLDYRSLRFSTQTLPQEDFQGNAVINYTEEKVPFTRILEHKHFEFSPPSPKTVITHEYPQAWTPEREPYYPINDETNMRLFHKYKALADQEKDVFFGGRLAEYRYYDMHQVIASALSAAKNMLHFHSL